MMHVELIGRPQFIGVPFELVPDQETLQAKIDKKQDEGTDAARLVECAGRTCYDSFGNGRASASYHDHIKQVGHGSVTEHVHLNFFVSGVSRGLTHELVRHRHSNFSQRSTRYVDESESDWALHPLITKYQHKLNKEAIVDTIELCKRTYKEVASDLEKLLIDDGIEKVTARKQARGAGDYGVVASRSLGKENSRLVGQSWHGRNRIQRGAPG